MHCLCRELDWVEAKLQSKYMQKILDKEKLLDKEAKKSKFIKKSIKKGHRPRGHLPHIKNGQILVVKDVKEEAVSEAKAVKEEAMSEA